MMSTGVYSARSGPQYAMDGLNLTRRCYRRGGLLASSSKKTFTFFGAILLAATTASTQKYSWVEAVRATGEGRRTDHFDGATNRNRSSPKQASRHFHQEEAEAEGPLQGLVQQFRRLAVSVSQGCRRPFLSTPSSVPSGFCLGVGIPTSSLPRQSTPRTWAAGEQGDNANGAGLDTAARGDEGLLLDPSATLAVISSMCCGQTTSPHISRQGHDVGSVNKFNVLQALLEEKKTHCLESTATFLELRSFANLSWACRTMRTTLQDVWRDWIRTLGWWRLVRFLAREEEQVVLPWVKAGAPPGDKAIECHMELEEKRRQEHEQQEDGEETPAVAHDGDADAEMSEMMDMPVYSPHPPPRKGCDFERGNIPVYNFQTKSFIHCEKDAATSGSGAGEEHGASGSDSSFRALDTTDTAGERYVERAAASSVSAVGISSPVSPQTQRAHEDQAAWPAGSDERTLIDYLYAIDGIGKDLVSSLQQRTRQERESDPTVRLFHAMWRQLDCAQKKVANENRSHENETNNVARRFIPPYTYLAENTRPVAPSPPWSSKWELIELTWDTFLELEHNADWYTADEYEALLHRAPTSVRAYFAPSDVARTCADITEPRLRFLCFRALRGGINSRHQKSTSATQQERRARGPSAGTPPAPRGQETPFEAADMLDAEAKNCNGGGADQLHHKSEHQALLKASAALREFGTAGNLLQVDIVLFQKSMGQGENSRSLLHTIRAQMFEWGGDMEGFKVPDESGNGSHQGTKYNEKRAEKGWRVRGSHVGEGGDAFYAPLASTYDTNFLVTPVAFLRWKILLIRDDEDTLRMLKAKPLVEHEIEDRLRRAYGERQSRLRSSRGPPPSKGTAMPARSF